MTYQSEAQLENKSELRFKGFTDPWEQRKLGELKGLKKGFMQKIFI